MPKRKSDLPFRTVFNGRSLSQYLETPATRISTLGRFLASLPPRAWIYGYDLRDAFYAFTIHPDSRPLLMVRYGDLVFRYRCYPMGISPSMPMLCAITSALVDCWRTRVVAGAPVEMFAYADDLNGWATAQWVAKEHSDFTGREIAELGLYPSPKSPKEPEQAKVILGNLVDSRTMTVSLPQAKLETLVEMASQYLARPEASARQMLSLAGRLMDARFASPLFRAAAYALYPHVSASSGWDEVSPLSREALARLAFIKECASQANGHPFRYDPALATRLVTDATPETWSMALLSGPHAGAALNGRWVDLPSHLRPLGPWSDHINFLELMVLYLALHLFQAELSGSTLWWWVDNQVAAAYMRKKGGAVLCLNELAWQILLRVWQMHVHLTPPRYVPSKDNPADYGTRHAECDSVRISPRAFERLSLQHGPFATDLFANSGNALCRTYFSAVPDAGSAGTDALLQNWRGLRGAWIFPPSHLLEQTVLKIAEERPKGVLVLPHAPNLRWWQQWIALSMRTQELSRADFKVDGPDTSSIWLSLSERYLLAVIR